MDRMIANVVQNGVDIPRSQAKFSRNSLSRRLTFQNQGNRDHRLDWNRPLSTSRSSLCEAPRRQRNAASSTFVSTTTRGGLTLVLSAIPG